MSGEGGRSSAIGKAEDASPHLLVPALLLSLLLAVVLVQMWRQTVLGWFLVLAEFTIPALGLSYFLLEERLLEPWPLIIVAVLIAISVGLVWNRPTRAV